MSIKVYINDRLYEFGDAITIMQACEVVGIKIPKFCYHKRLSIAGNCRMCLVQIEDNQKLVASCVQVISDDMHIYTNTKLVNQARAGVLEFFLINHPLDCPICDKGGECDLQDQVFRYGKCSSRYKEEKRAVQHKDFGSFIETHMTRCIHCMRCVRFLDEVAGTGELVALGKGEDMRIDVHTVSNAICKGITSELSGNIIDLCPVGALNSAPYAYTARPWELTKIPSIDLSDAVCSNTVLHVRGHQVMRVLPRECDYINEEWLSDKARFNYDGLKYQRLVEPIWFDKIMKRRESISWDEAYDKLYVVLNESTAIVSAIVGHYSDVESIFAIKELFSHKKNWFFDCREEGSILDPSFGRASYVFNTTIQNIEDSDECLLIGTNPRLEAAILNARLRKALIHNQLKISVLGNRFEANYPYTYLGCESALLKAIYEGKHEYARRLSHAKKPMLILGSNILKHQYDGQAILYYSYKIAEKYGLIRDDWNGFNVLNTKPSRVGALDLDFTANFRGRFSDIGEMESDVDVMLRKSNVLLLFGADDINIDAISDDVFVVYIGHHADKVIRRADLVLPSPAYSEKDAMYLNLEGRLQHTCQAVPPLGVSKQEWMIVTEIAQRLKIELNFHSLEDVRAKISMKSDFLRPENMCNVLERRDIAIPKFTNFRKKELIYQVSDFYTGDQISNNSLIMIEHSNSLRNK
ncbi:NADH-quinone oxidoreductase subunit NuoG [Candidatus Fokinia crypta]|uniref:NADH-quinone oxidoreductase n=1 Tax=Candidatus Fokinia crypta TaxID=1920990 RepID=A0ABZ0USK8_9RICK|nr:NADH-quinone oxidoreductase subunit NuoG [Candidatus Fokinia cryptica]WPX98133.1 NADH-quinone oxidoreductase subunit G [Candidatus Fokinia cryptica]